jgi:uncharacterized protein (TIGR02284 family)
MAFENKAVRTVIEVLHDGEKGFSALSTELKEPRAKAFFMQESTTRGRFATELETALGAATGKEVSEGGTASGTLHRTWGELKAKLGGSDHTLLETAEQGEDAAKKAYEEVLKLNDIPAPVRALLQEQQAHILQSHNAVKALRDSLAAA